MTKNQGTWNRRLRSLTAMNKKFIGTDLNGNSDYTRAARITTMFSKHSKEPKGSPFLSYTPKFQIATNFGAARNTAYFIDPRMMYFNYASGYAGEIEFYLPIASFPDDLAAVYDITLHQHVIKGRSVEVFLKDEAIKKLEHVLGQGKGKSTYDRITLNSTKFFKPVMNGKVGVVKDAPKKPMGSILGYFKKLLGMKTKEAAIELTEDSNLACVDLLQLFWK